MFRIPFSLLAELTAELSAVYPNEGCGFVFGTTDDSGTRCVRSFLLVPNEAEPQLRARRFSIGSGSYQAAEAYAEDLGLEILGVIHTHPDHPSMPSATDRANAIPWYEYLIISLMNRDLYTVQAWQLTPDNQFMETPVELV
jgi:proteasome lid subunit RPN8/RPN11